MMVFLRLIFFFALAAVVAFGAVWVADHPGRVAIDWGGWRLDAPLALFGFAILVLMVVAAGLSRLLRLMRRAPLAWRLGSGARSRREGYRAFTEGMVAVAAGDARAAQAAAQRAKKLLDQPALALLLSAQAAQAAGDEDEAGRHYAAMLGHSETEFLGLRGLVGQALRAGDRARALDYARQAFALKPDAAWTAKTLLDLETAQGDWADAQVHLDAALKRKALPAAEGQRKRGLIELARARDAVAAGDGPVALKLAKSAHGAAPDLVPATALYAELLVHQGQGNKAAKVVRAAWGIAPHPTLARLYLEAMGASGEGDRLRRLRELTHAAPDHAESRIVLADAHLAAGDVAGARSALDGIAEGSPRVFRLRARIAEAEGGDLRRWLELAADSVDPSWVCGHCGHAAPEWHSHCPNCGAFDAMAWRQPPVVVPETPLAEKGEMLSSRPVPPADPVPPPPAEG